jgi:hypothetical protein
MLGILWMDDSDTTLAKKIGDAAQRYRARFGQAATLCYANPAEVPEPTVIGGLRVEPRSNILRHHILVGRSATSEKPKDLAA